MNKKISFDESTLRILYYRNKDYLIPCIIIFTCIVLFIKVIIPQIQDIISIRNEEKNLYDRVQTLKTELNFLSGLDTRLLDTDLKITMNALPSGKDFAGIISSIDSSAINSGVDLEDFGFVVGELSTKSAKMNTQPSIQISLTVKNNIDGVKRFIKELSTKLPVSEVVSLEIKEKVTDIGTVFYYKPFPPVEFNNDTLQKPLSSKEVELINKISGD